MEMSGEIHPQARNLWCSLNRWLEGGGNRTNLDTLVRRGGRSFQPLPRIGL